MTRDAPLGIFDSGFGGLTVARSVIDQLPHESVVYVGDTARQPYGPKPIGEVREYALECLDHLVEQGVKALVIACNSASAAMLRDARERYDVPVVEVIFPATRRAVQATRNGRIGVICTRATAESMAYDDAFAAAPHLTLQTQVCPRFVEFVEAGVTGGDPVALQAGPLAVCCCVMAVSGVACLATALFGKRVELPLALLLVPVWLYGTEALPFFKRLYQDKFVAGLALAPATLALSWIYLRRPSSLAALLLFACALATACVHGLVYALTCLGGLALLGPVRLTDA